jgi:hypothetical protein
MRAAPGTTSPKTPACPADRQPILPSIPTPQW